MACPRPRVTKTGHAYMPPRYRTWKNDCITQLIADAPTIYPNGDPCILEASFVYPRPKKFKAGPKMIKTTRPDLDNLLKSICDALQEAHMIRDDAQIYKMIGSKWYWGNDYIIEEPHIHLKLEFI